MTQLASFQDVVDPAAPSGIDLRNVPEFHAIERMLEPAARESRIQPDNDGPPTSADVDWGAVLDASAELAKQGRDLRLLVIVVRALANQDGLAGLTAGVTLINETLEAHWDSVHPLLRERDDPKEAALRRINSLKQIENDDNGLLGDLEMNPIMTLPGLGIITGQNLFDAALSEFDAMNRAPSGLSADEREKLRSAYEANKNRVTAACRAIAAEQPDLAKTLKKDVGEALAAIEALESGFSEKAGLSNGGGIRFPELTEFLNNAKTMMDTGMVKTDVAEPQIPDDTQETNAPTSTPKAAPSGSISGEINSRDDVERVLGKIIAFYERTEPSSPIPHLARRVQRMVHMDFMELMSEVAPSGMKEFRNAAGVQDDKGK
ncbi:type VI secretion system protein TssA [Cognatiyoonia sp. IB215182]|uniref:type VI secretion system protein TssA n=1 Tax=Cognatiyoonia sp. IB215182 TaxID=3097353 RepID=UPI002A14012D|nr:type VI secretion system protein TssA [Cognatiyoonia sp. IB215182]MDX8352708.1 type VI secretion system protein TssA [Cognatiyoonia sp. IB215182]